MTLCHSSRTWCRSEWQIPQKRISISTSCGPGARRWIVSGPRRACALAAPQALAAVDFGAVARPPRSPPGRASLLMAVLLAKAVEWERGPFSAGPRCKSSVKRQRARRSSGQEASERAREAHGGPQRQSPPGLLHPERARIGRVEARQLAVGDELHAVGQVARLEALMALELEGAGVLAAAPEVETAQALLDGPLLQRHVHEVARGVLAVRPLCRAGVIGEQ